MTKAEMIERFGADYYEQHKKRTREKMYKIYHADKEKCRERVRKWDSEHSAHKRAYAKTRREIYRIGSRDSARASKMHLIAEGQEVHHLRYHSDNNDPTWIDDIVIMSREDHRKWHSEHPEFNALNNVI